VPPRTRRGDIAPSSHGYTADRVYALVKDGILRNQLPDGTRLRETELAAEIGVSRTPVREALRRLTGEGLVETTRHLGCRVRGWQDRDLNEIFRLRALLESQAARLAAQNLGEPGIATLSELCDAMEALVASSGADASKRDALPTLNNRFHSLILAGSGSQRLQTLATQVISLPLVLHTFTRYEDREISRSMAHHRELVDAFRAGDPDWAESVMRAHIYAGHAVMKRGLAIPRLDNERSG